jgi:hypothetical protein
MEIKEYLISTKELIFYYIFINGTLSLDQLKMLNIIFNKYIIEYCYASGGTE